MRLIREYQSFRGIVFILLGMILASESCWAMEEGGKQEVSVATSSGKRKISSEEVAYEDEKESRYIGKKIYGIGIKEDPNPGSKEGKGRQDLISPFWIEATAQYIGNHIKEMQELIRKAMSKDDPYIYLVNYSRTFHDFDDANAVS